MWSRLWVNSHVIPISISTHLLLPTKLSNIFYSKILHVSFSTSDLLCTNSDIISYTSTLALFGVKVLHVLQSRAGLQEKTTYRSTSFWIWWWSKGVPHTLWKATGGVISKVVRKRLTGRSQVLLSGYQYQLLPGFLCVKARLSYVVEMAKGLDVTLNDPAGLRKWILIVGWM